MRKSALKKLKVICDKPMSEMKSSEIAEMLHDICPQGERFKSACMCDRDWWYVVQYIDDTNRHGEKIPLVVVKSYNKTKQNYVYRCMECVIFLYILCTTAKSLGENEMM